MSDDENSGFNLAWFPYYLNDWAEISVRLCDTLAFGAFHKLLMVYARNRYALRNDDKVLARIANVELRQWKEMKHFIMPLFQVSECGQYLHSKKFDEIFEECAQQHERRVENGKKGAAKRREMRLVNGGSHEKPD